MRRVPRGIHELRIRAFGHTQLHAVALQILGGLFDCLSEIGIEHVRARSRPPIELIVINPDYNVVGIHEAEFISRRSRPAAYQAYPLSGQEFANPRPVAKIHLAPSQLHILRNHR